MQITTTGPTSSNSTDTGLTGTKTAKQIDAEFAALMQQTKDDFAAITNGGVQGYMKWKIEELRKQIAARVMNEMHLTPEALAKMSDKDRLAAESAVTREVEKELKMAMNEEMKRKQHSLVAASDSFQSVLSAAQELAT